MSNSHPAAANHSMSIRGSRCTALIHPFASEPSGSGWSYCSPFYRSVFLDRVWALRHSSGGHGRTGEKDHLPVDSHTRSVRWPAPLRASTLKEHFSKRATGVIAYFWRCLITSAFLNVVIIWCLRMATIAASCAWAFSTLRKLSRMVYVLYCGDMTISGLCNRLFNVKHSRVPLPQSSPQLPRQMAHTCAISWAGTWCGHLGVLRRWGHLRVLWRCGPLRVLWRVLSRSVLQRALSRSCERRQAWGSRGRWACVGHEWQRACGSRGWWRACGSRGWLVLAWGRTLSRHQRISFLQFSYVVSGRSMGWWELAPCQNSKRMVASLSAITAASQQNSQEYSI